MADVLNFMGEHWFLTWCLAWGLWPVCWALTSIFTAPFNAMLKAHRISRRADNIFAHGWPENKLMNADGDIVHPPAPPAPKEDPIKVTLTANHKPSSDEGTPRYRQGDGDHRRG